MDQNELVLISGKQGSGKSTLAKGITESPLMTELFPNIHRVKFADFIYEQHDSIANNLRFCGIDSVPDKDGELLQILGAHFRKKYGADFFVNIVKNKIKATIDTHCGGNLFVIDDCRFPNEFNAFPFAFSVRLIAPEDDR
ncbi:MAG: hypothetical protein SFU25_01585, partial [Candidatus Caenarcaniphilales bacterium]|nr:hypothetical protein [Candidatus Caenarcaniphilales bacterium]